MDALIARSARLGHKARTPPHKTAAAAGSPSQQPLPAKKGRQRALSASFDAAADTCAERAFAGLAEGMFAELRASPSRSPP